MANPERIRELVEDALSDPELTVRLQVYVVPHGDVSDFQLAALSNYYMPIFLRRIEPYVRELEREFNRAVVAEGQVLDPPARGQERPQRGKRAGLLDRLRIGGK